MKKVLSVTLALILCAFVFAACGKKSETRNEYGTIGKSAVPLTGGMWVYEGADGAKYTYVFGEDGTGAYTDSAGHEFAFVYADKDGTLTLTYDGSESETVFKYHINGSSMSLTSTAFGTTTVYEKKG